MDTEIIKGHHQFYDRPEKIFLRLKQRNEFYPRSYFQGGHEFEILFQTKEHEELDLYEQLPLPKEFEEYFEQGKNKFHERNDHVLIIDHRLETHQKVLPELSGNDYYIKITDNIQNMEEDLPRFLPIIICYQMQAESEDHTEEEKQLMNGISSFITLMETINRTKDYHPYILIFNDASRGKAYQKAHNYDRILVNKKDFEIHHLEMVVRGFQSNTSPNNGPNNNSDQKVLFLKPPDPLTLLEVEKDIVIHLLSENKMVFSSDAEMGVYSTFRIPSPLNLYVTVIPTEQSVVIPKAKGKLYLGLLCSTSEVEKMELRRLVNLLIQVESSSDEPLEFKTSLELREDRIKQMQEELVKEREEQEEDYKEKKKKNEEDED